MNAKLLFTHALTPLHPGTGQGVGVIDLPIAREVVTGLPYLPGSSLKGVLRDAGREKLDKKTRHEIFGPDTQKASEHAGSVQFTDQRLLLFPVRSLRGTFAWVTSPLVLQRCARDMKAAGLTPPPLPSAFSTHEECVVGKGSAITADGKLYLEDLELTARDDDESVGKWAKFVRENLFTDAAWQTMLTERFCIVHDDVLSFLLQTATEVVARIRLNRESKTVATGGLWYEEALPAESILAGLVIATPVKADADSVFTAISTLSQGPLQVGGNATVGRGICQLRLSTGGA